MLDILFQIQFEQETYDSDKGWLPVFNAIEQKIQEEFFPPETLKKFSEEVRKTIETNYLTGKTYSGDPVAPLKLSTIKRKGHARPFYDTGKLFGSILLHEINNGYEVFISPERSKVAAFLQEDDSRGYRVGRPAFGITDVKADSLLNFIVRKN